MLHETQLLHEQARSHKIKKLPLDKQSPIEPYPIGYLSVTRHKVHLVSSLRYPEYLLPP